MAIVGSGLQLTVNEFNSGAIAPLSNNVPVYIGSCSLGTGETVYSLTDPDQTRKTLGYGPLAEATANTLKLAGGQVYAVPVVSDVAGTIGTVSKVGGSSPTITVSGSPVDSLTFTVKIIDGGAVGTATFKYSTSLPSQTTEFSPTTLTAATYPIATTGITLAFPAGTYVAGDVFTFTTTAPGFSSAKLQSAFTKFLASGAKVDRCYVVGQPADLAAAATLAVALQALLDQAFNISNPIVGFIEVPSGTDAAIIAAFSTVTCNQVAACVGDIDMISAITGKTQKRPAAYAIVTHAQKLEIHKDVGWVGAGALSNVLNSYRDEGATPGLASRFLCLRTRNEKIGYFAESGKTLAQPGSDLADLNRRMIANKFARIVSAGMIDYTNQEFDLSAAGTLADSDKGIIEEKINSLIDNLGAKHISKYKFNVKQTNNMSLDPSIYCSLAILPKGKANYIYVDLAYVVKLTA